MVLNLVKISSAVAALAYVLLTAAVAASQTPDDVPSFRCGVETIAVGDQQYAVRNACGPPAKATVSGSGAVEEWVYNFGPTRFIYYVTFVNGRVERIQAGDYGFLKD